MQPASPAYRIVKFLIARGRRSLPSLGVWAINLAKSKCIALQKICHSSASAAMSTSATFWLREAHGSVLAKCLRCFLPFHKDSRVQRGWVNLGRHSFSRTGAHTKLRWTGRLLCSPQRNTDSMYGVIVSITSGCSCRGTRGALHL